MLQELNIFAELFPYKSKTNWRIKASSYICPSMRISAINIIFRIDYKALLPVLILSAFLLICLTSENSSEPVCSAEAYEQLELKSLTDANTVDEGSRGMATNPVSRQKQPPQYWQPAWLLLRAINPIEAAGELQIFPVSPLIKTKEIAAETRIRYRW